MSTKWILAAAPLLAAFSANLHAQAPMPGVTAEQMMRHIKVLASDEYEGRKPGTEGERKTTSYIVSQLAALGLDPAGENGWYQPVGLVERVPSTAQVSWKLKGKVLKVGPRDFVLTGREGNVKIEDAPAYFVGHGLVIPEAGIDQLAGLDLNGAIAFLWATPPEGLESDPGYDQSVASLIERGAAAVIGVYPDEVRWANVVAFASEGSTRLQIIPAPPVRGVTSQSAFGRLLGKGDGRPDPKADPRAIRPIRLNARGTLDVSTRINSYTTNNVVGRLRGSARNGESVLYLGHWDHLGICGTEKDADRICNGAVDNASGIAMMIEITRALARGKRPERDILVMATTAEEMGLLGAEYFSTRPTVPLGSIVAAINVDTVAIAGKGEPVAVLGRGHARIDALIDETARELGRAIDTDDEIDAFLERQDGWKLTKAGVPTIMVGGSFSDMKKLGAFLGSSYHKADDDLNRPIELGGAAEDADLMIALGRKLADPKLYRPTRN
ncbi:MAG: M28 family peptidase [Sphingosinicella sp.]|nr:M28 family peptidase [Sphingosinicella sp.]